MVGHQGAPNPVLQQGWDAYPWAAAHRSLHGGGSDASNAVRSTQPRTAERDGAGHGIG